MALRGGRGTQCPCGTGWQLYHRAGRQNACCSTRHRLTEGTPPVGFAGSVRACRKPPRRRGSGPAAVRRISERRRPEAVTPSPACGKKENHECGPSD